MQNIYIYANDQWLTMGGKFLQKFKFKQKSVDLMKRLVTRQS